MKPIFEPFVLTDTKLFLSRHVSVPLTHPSPASQGRHRSAPHREGGPTDAEELPPPCKEQRDQQLISCPQPLLCSPVATLPRSTAWTHPKTGSKFRIIQEEVQQEQVQDLRQFTIAELFIKAKENN